MEIADVKDRESLKAYLDALQEAERRAVAVRVAYRAAARVLPFAARDVLITDWARKRDLTPVAIFGAIAVSVGSVQGYPPETGAVANAANAAFAANAADAADAAALAAYAANAAAEAANAADAAADAAYAADIDLWPLIQADLQGDTGSDPLWPDGVPRQIADIWTDAERAMQDHAADWSFWINWYERVRDGKNWHPAEVVGVLNRITKDDWDKGPAHINPMFDEVLAGYLKEDRLKPTDETNGDVSGASYFDFIEIERTMRAVAFKGDNNAFASDEVRQDFLNALADLRIDLDDWCELARAQLQGRNHPVTAVVAIEMLLDQIGQIERGEPVSLRDLVRRGSRARRLARGKKLEDALGDELSPMLAESLDGYADTVRAHLGHILEVLDVLRQLDLEGVDSADALASLKAGVARLFSQDSDVLLPPDNRTRAILNDMIAELEEDQAEIGEATTDVAQQQRGKRWAEKYGGVAATVRQYAEKGSEFANKGGTKIDQFKKWAGRWDTIRKIMESLDMIPPGSG